MQYLIIPITVVMLLTKTDALSQQTPRPLTKRVMVKTNLLNLFARQPTLSVEMAVSRTVGAELSFVKGQFNHILFTDHYDYQGFLLRAKKYFVPLQVGPFNPYAAVYTGNLRRHVQTKGQSIANGYLGYPSRNFSSNSIRGGVSLGGCFFASNKFIFDQQTSLGYGRYLKLNKNDPDTYSSGYLDVQVWLSIGYCF